MWDLGRCAWDPNRLIQQSVGNVRGAGTRLGGVIRDLEPGNGVAGKEKAGVWNSGNPTSYPVGWGCERGRRGTGCRSLGVPTLALHPGC